MFHNQMRPCELLHVNLRRSKTSDDCYVDLKLRTILHDDDLSALHLDPEGFGQFAESLTGRANLGRHNVVISGSDWMLRGYGTWLNKPVLQTKPIEPLTDRDKAGRREAADANTQTLPGIPAPPPLPPMQYEVMLTMSVAIPIIGDWKGYPGLHRSIGSVVDVEFEESDRVAAVAQEEVQSAGIVQIVRLDADGQASIETRLDQIADFFIRWRRGDESMAEAIARWVECGGVPDDDDCDVTPHVVTLLDVPLDAITEEMLDAADLATLHRWYERLAGKRTEATSETLVRGMIVRRLDERRAKAESTIEAVDATYEDDGPEDGADGDEPTAYMN